MLHLSLFAESPLFNRNDSLILLLPASAFNIGTDSGDDLIKTYTTFFILFQPTYNIYPPLLLFVSLKKSIFVLVDDDDPDIKIINTLTYHKKRIKESSNHHRRTISHRPRQQVQNQRPTGKVGLCTHTKIILHPC